MNKFQETRMNQLQTDVVEALLALDAAADRAVSAAVRLRAGLDAVNDRAVSAAVRLRAGLDAVNDQPPDPVTAISLAHSATADYLRQTAAEHDELAEVA